MKKQIKFLYDGSWTQWFDVDDMPNLKGLKIDSVIIEEKMTKDQAEEYIREFYDMNFKEF